MFFDKYHLKPHSRVISEVLNVDIFDGKEKFSFLFEFDNTELRQEYLSGLITLNEYRVPTGKVRDSN